MRTLRILWKLSLLSIARSFQNPIGAVLFITGKLIRFIFFYYFVTALLMQTKVLAGYSMAHTVVFFLTFTLVDTISQLLFRAVYSFRPMLVSGDFDGVLTKPFHPFVVILLGSLDILDAIVLTLYLGLTVFWVMHIPEVGAVSVLLYTLAMMNSLLIATAFHILILAFGILTIEVDHTAMIYRDISRLGSFPVDIYKEPLRSIITVAIPIGIMMSVPAKALFGLLNWQMALWYGAITTVFVMVSWQVWRYALSRYQSWGGN